MTFVCTVSIVTALSSYYTLVRRSTSKSQYVKKSPEDYCYQTNPICETHHKKESVGSDRVDRDDRRQKS